MKALLSVIAVYITLAFVVYLAFQGVEMLNEIATTFQQGN